MSITVFSVPCNLGVSFSNSSMSITVTIVFSRWISLSVTRALDRELSRALSVTVNVTTLSLVLVRLTGCVILGRKFVFFGLFCCVIGDTRLHNKCSLGVREVRNCGIDFFCGTGEGLSWRPNAELSLIFRSCRAVRTSPLLSDTYILSVSTAN